MAAFSAAFVSLGSKVMLEGGLPGVYDMNSLAYHLSDDVISNLAALQFCLVSSQSSVRSFLLLLHP